jgi:hypothetical protein
MRIILLRPLLNLIEITKSKSSAPNTPTLILTNTITLAITMLILNGGWD